ncbi:hypothetical protein GCM10023183_30400 [Nibribacter koreensis]|uniref:Uncharacterized protein n=1 Tax=Nibribacter koreensis TaxID=1084519 RepID=A0ABP8FV20_9BACT
MSYEEKETFKLIDSTKAIHQMSQSLYDRYFFEWIGFFGSSNEFQEVYQVSYGSDGPSPIDLSVNLESYIGEGHSAYDLRIQINEFEVYASPNKLTPSVVPLEIMGRPYNRVYSLKAYSLKVPNVIQDSAIVLWNREYGLIQLQFSNGKTITRKD